MKKQIIYEIGDLRIKLYPNTTFFEVVDGHRRLSTTLRTLDEIPSLMTLLIENFIDVVVKYESKIEKTIESDKKALEENKEILKDRREKGYPDDYIARLELSIEKLVERINTEEEFVDCCKRLIRELDKCYDLLLKFMDLRSKL